VVQISMGWLAYLTQNGSFWRCSSEPISWLVPETIILNIL